MPVAGVSCTLGSIPWDGSVIGTACKGVYAPKSSLSFGRACHKQERAAVKGRPGGVPGRMRLCGPCPIGPNRPGRGSSRVFKVV